MFWPITFFEEPLRSGIRLYLLYVDDMMSSKPCFFVVAFIRAEDGPVGSAVFLERELIGFHPHVLSVFKSDEPDQLSGPVPSCLPIRLFLEL